MDGKQNYGAILDTQLPENVERHIREILTVKPVHFQMEAAVKQ